MLRNTLQVTYTRVFIPRHNGKLVYQLLRPVPGVSVSIRGTHATSDSHLTPAHKHTNQILLQYYLTVTTARFIKYQVSHLL